MEPHLSGTATSVPVPRAAPANPVAATKKVLGTHVSAGADYTCAVLRTGAVKCWGAGDKLGLGDHENRGDDPNEMGDALPAVELGKGRTAISVSAGAEHTCAVLDSGAVKCWGAGSYGTLGLGDTKARGYAPNELGDALPAVDLGTGRTALAVSAGSSHTCAVLDTGAVKCWGRGAEGPLGLGDDKTRGDNPKEMGDALPAVNLGGGGRAVAVTAGVRHTCALLDTGAVKCWGRGTEDRQARGADPNQLGDALPAVDLGAGRTAVAVSAGYSHTCALLDTGAVKCWGYGAEGQLGLGDKKARGRKPNEMGDALPAVNLGGLVR
jgi:alpha-tubulin suppressor-like RCC1 family protein